LDWIISETFMRGSSGCGIGRGVSAVGIGRGCGIEAEAAPELLKHVLGAAEHGLQFADQISGGAIGH
jgi:hypothetical protein